MKRLVLALVIAAAAAGTAAPAVADGRDYIACLMVPTTDAWLCVWEPTSVQ